MATRLVAGDAEALAECYRSLGPQIRRYLGRFVSRAEADDVLQVVFLELWRSRDRLDPDRSLEAWLFSIARKRAIDQLRRQRHDIVDVSALRALVGEDGRDLAERFAWSSELHRALACLSDEQREAIELVYFADLTHAQSAARLGVPTGTVKARVSRGMLRLGRLMEEGAPWQPHM